MSCSPIALLAALLITGASGPALAQSPRSSGTAPEGTSTAPLGLHLSLGARALDPEIVRAAVERELGRPVVVVTDANAPLAVEIDPAARVRIRYQRPDGQELARRVDLPDDDVRAIEIIALLSGNLVRDEAAELVKALRDEHASAAPENPSDAAVGSSAEPAPPVRPAPVNVATKASAKAEQRTKEPELLRRKPLSVNLSLFHPISLIPSSERHVVNIELGLAYGRVGALEGVALELGFLQVETHADGVALGLLRTRTRGPVRGLTSSLLWNDGAGSITGASLSGALALHGDVTGVEVAGLGATAEHVDGVQLSGAALRATSLRGAQVTAGLALVRGPAQGCIVAGVVGIARDVEGCMLAAGANVARDVDGFVLAGGTNVARRVHGVSLAAVNVAQQVDGVQLGVVNVASEVRGAAIGVVSIAGNGRVQPSFWTSTSMPLNLSVKFVAGYAYSELGVGYDAESRFAPEAGLGAHVPLGGPFSSELGFHYSETHDTADPEPVLHRDFHYRLRFALRLTGATELFAGGGARHGMSGSTENEAAPEFLAGVSLSERSRAVNEFAHSR